MHDVYYVQQTNQRSPVSRRYAKHMRLNLTRPLQFLQWSSYISLLLMVKIFIIFPLAVLLFNDFYLRLLPADSSQWVPLSTFNKNVSTNEIIYDQIVDRVPLERELPKIIDNGLAQHVSLRDHIVYKMDLDYKFYCLMPLGGQFNRISNLELKIYASDDPESLIYARSVPIICLKPCDSIATAELYKYGPSRQDLFQKEWLNHIKLHDKIDIDSNTRVIQHLTLPTSSFGLIMLPESGCRFRMNFEQGLRNVMLRYHKITYAVGIIVFDFAIFVLFAITTFVTFFLISKRNAAERSLKIN